MSTLLWRSSLVLVASLNCCVTLVTATSAPQSSYAPTWASLDTRPIPEWYPGAKLGIMIHWGLYSVPSYGNGEEWFWQLWRDPSTTERAIEKKEYMWANYRPAFKYADFTPDFRAELYNPEQWAELFKASGARYVVMTAKHHDGYTLWPSEYSFNWNSVDTGPGRDLIGELAGAIRNNTDLHFGVYNSLYEWYHPLFLIDKRAKFRTSTFVDNKMLPELKSLVSRYKPDVIWSDGDWMASEGYFKSKEFLAWLYTESSVKDTVVVNDRWGKSTTWCRHGDYYTCGDKTNPGELQPHMWENAMSLDSRSWGYRRNAELSDYLSMEKLISTLISTISCGGNMLVNIGPASDGRIPPIFEERLRDLGLWLEVNGEAVFDTTPWIKAQRDVRNRNVWYTKKDAIIYAFFMDWPDNDFLSLSVPQPLATTRVTLLGYKGNAFEWEKDKRGGILVLIPPISYKKLPCKWAWTLKLEEVS